MCVWEREREKRSKYKESLQKKISSYGYVKVTHTKIVTNVLSSKSNHISYKGSSTIFVILQSKLNPDVIWTIKSVKKFSCTFQDTFTQQVWVFPRDLKYKF